MFRHPGHWLLIVAAAMAIVSLLVALFGAVLTTFNVDATPLFAIYGVVSLAVALAHAIVVRTFKPIRWKFAFGFLSLLYALQAVAYVGIALRPGTLIMVAQGLTIWGQIGLCSWVVIASILDKMNGQARDWLHWTGIIVYVATHTTWLCWMIAARFII